MNQNLAIIQRLAALVARDLEAGLVDSQTLLASRQVLEAVAQELAGIGRPVRVDIVSVEKKVA
jgi:hypothetical protein